MSVGLDAGKERERERARVVNDSSLNDTVCHTTEIINHLKASPSSNVIPSITALAVTTITTEHQHKKKISNIALNVRMRSSPLMS